MAIFNKKFSGGEIRLRYSKGPRSLVRLNRTSLLIIVGFFLLLLLFLNNYPGDNPDVVVPYKASVQIRGYKGCPNAGFQSEKWCQTECWDGGEMLLPKVINEPACSSYDSHDLLLYIYSAPRNKDLRNTVRETVSFYFDVSETALVFILGIPSDWTPKDELSLEDEIVRKGDILRLNVRDSYDNLTYKGLGLFNWITNSKCGKKLKLLAKADDNHPMVFSQLFVGFETIKKQYRESYALTTHCIGPMVNIKVHTRKWKAKHNVAYSEYPGERWPSYCKGDYGTFLTPNVALRLLEAAKGTKVLRIEDAYFTGILRMRACLPINMLGTADFHMRLYPVIITKKHMGIYKKENFPKIQDKTM